MDVFGIAIFLVGAFACYGWFRCCREAQRLQRDRDRLRRMAIHLATEIIPLHHFYKRGIAGHNPDADYGEMDICQVLKAAEEATREDEK